MHKVIFWDRTSVLIQDNQVDAIAAAKQRGKAFWLRHVAGRDLVEPGSIARVTQAGGDEIQLPNYNRAALPVGKSGKRRADMSEAELAKRRDKIANMKADFLAGKYKPKEAK